MQNRIRLPLGVVLGCVFVLPALAASPTPDQVYQALRAGNVAQAQQMMTQVLNEYPRVGRAHFVAAEVDARAGNYGLARQELRTAEALDPSLATKDPRGVKQLRQQLGEEPVGMLAQQTVRPSHPSRLPLFLFLIGGAVVLWLVLRRRAAAMGYQQYPGQYPGGTPPGPGGYGGGGYPGGYMPGGGSGIMGSVASGLAVGAGVAAGEELVRHVIGGGNTGAGGFVPPAEAGQLPDPNADMGGNDFGLNDPGSWDDGSGSGSGGGGGWDDGGGGGDSGGGWS